jgi:hypothetical protein
LIGKRGGDAHVADGLANAPHIGLIGGVVGGDLNDQLWPGPGFGQAMRAGRSGRAGISMR